MHTRPEKFQAGKIREQGKIKKSNLLRARAVFRGKLKALPVFRSELEDIKIFFKKKA
jgi:hypothetical protein